MADTEGWQLVAAPIIRDAEGLKLHPYVCPTGHLSIGYGHVIEDEGPVSPWGAPWAEGITKDQAEELLRIDLAAFGRAVRACVTVPLTGPQLGALVSWAYNCKDWQTSTLVKVLNRGLYDAVPAELRRWNKGRDPKTKKLKVLGGLVTRREREVAAWIAGTQPKG